MKNYDDLQRFKEKTQTTHIEFKDMSEQSRNSDNTNWAIIKQLVNNGADTVFDNRQTINVMVPELADPSEFIPPASSSAPIAESLPSFKTLSQTAQNADSLLDSIAASLKPVAQPEIAISESRTGPSELQSQAVMKQSVVNIAELHPESVAHAGSSLFDQLAQQSPVKSLANSAAILSETTPRQQMLSQQVGQTPNPNPQQVEQTVNPSPRQVAQMPKPQQPQQVSSASLHQLLQEQPPPYPDYPSQPVQPLQTGYQSQPDDRPLLQPQLAPPDYQAQQPGYPAQHPQMPPRPMMPYSQPHPQRQRHVSSAAASPNISYKQLFSLADGSANQPNSKEMPLQSLLEKIASCR